MTRRRSAGILLVALLTLGATLALRVPPAAAIDMNAVAPDLDLPGFKITPFVTERAEYESNVFQTPSHAKDDLIIKTIPGIVLELPLGAHRLDRDEHTWGLTAFWKVAPKTDLLANGSYGFKEFDHQSQRDVDRYIGVVGVRGEITSRLVSTFRVGYEDREPRDSDRTAYRGVVASGDWVWTPTGRTRITLLTERFVAESIFATNLWYLANMVTLGIEQRFTPKLTGTVRLFGGINQYPDKVAKLNGVRAWRYDELAGLGVGLDYQIQRWLGIGADYTHTRRDSNFDNFDFKNDIVGAKVTLSF